MKKQITKVFDDLECFETRFDGTFSYSKEKDGRIYNGTGIIFEDRIFYTVSFFRKRTHDSIYSDILTEFSGELNFENETYKLINAVTDRNSDEFLFTFANGDKTIIVDCKKSDFKFQCDYLSK